MPTVNHPLFDPANLTDQEQERLKKLQGLVEAGIDPYPPRAKRSHTIAQARAAYEQNSEAEHIVSVTGRLRSNRDMGKLSFGDLEDGTGRIQILVKRDAMPEGWYANTWKKLVDLGDFLGVTGKLFVTRTGELTVEVQDVQFLSKTTTIFSKSKRRSCNRSMAVQQRAPLSPITTSSSKTSICASALNFI